MASVLLVDDEVEIARVLMAVLKHAGHQGHYAPSAREGLQFLATHETSLLILDIMMPEMNGIEMLRQIRRDPTLTALPVIMYTGADDPELRDRAEELGISAFVMKGRLDFSELRALIDRHGGKPA